MARQGRIATLTDAGCTHKFLQLPNGAIQHAESMLCLRPYPGETGAPWSPADGVADGTALVFWDGCATAGAVAFQQSANGAMVHVSSGKCLNLQGGAASPAEGARIVLDEACTQPLRLSAGPFPAPGAHDPGVGSPAAGILCCFHAAGVLCCRMASVGAQENELPRVLCSATMRPGRQRVLPQLRGRGAACLRGQRGALLRGGELGGRLPEQRWRSLWDMRCLFPKAAAA